MNFCIKFEWNPQVKKIIFFQDFLIDFGIIQKVEVEVQLMVHLKIGNLSYSYRPVRRAQVVYAPTGIVINPFFQSNTIIKII